LLAATVEPPLLLLVLLLALTASGLLPLGLGLSRLLLHLGLSRLALGLGLLIELDDLVDLAHPVFGPLHCIRKLGQRARLLDEVSEQLLCVDELALAALAARLGLVLLSQDRLVVVGLRALGSELFGLRQELARLLDVPVEVRVVDRA